MHAALPQVSNALGGKYKSGSRLKLDLASPAAVRTLSTILCCGLLAYFVLFSHLFDSGATYSQAPVVNGADSVSVTSSPFIVPDLSRLAQYRTSQWVTLEDGRSVYSPNHSILFSPNKVHPSPRVVLVVGLDSDTGSQEYLQQVLDDRLAYAKRHGYGVYARYLRDFASNEIYDPSPVAFAKVGLMREAMYAFADSEWMWWLDQDALIMDHSVDIEKDLLDPPVLDSLMLRDTPIIPPDGVVHTYKRVPAEQVRFILTQNDRGPSTASFLISNDQLYGHILMSYWMDPLHQRYGSFQNEKGYNRRLEASLAHMVQWHPAILSRLAIVPHKALCAWNSEGTTLPSQGYQSGGFIYVLHDTNEIDPPTLKVISDRWRTGLRVVASSAAA